MAYDFDTVVDRKESDSLKWERYGDRDVIPLWVADMDFRSPPAVAKALHARISHGLFGYNVPPAGLAEAVAENYLRQFSWQISPEWIVWLPGLVTGINVACRAVGNPGDEVAMLTPVYPP